MDCWLLLSWLCTSPSWQSKILNVPSDSRWPGRSWTGSRWAKQWPTGPVPCRSIQPVATRDCQCQLEDCGSGSLMLNHQSFGAKHPTSFQRSNAWFSQGPNKKQLACHQYQTLLWLFGPSRKVHCLHVDHPRLLALCTGTSSLETIWDIQAKYPRLWRHQNIMV